MTLDGEKSDWEEIYRRLARLDELGDEPAVWARMLRPIVRRFVGAFDGAPDVDFWERVADMDGYCGRDLWSGWITAFCVWSPEGRWLPPTPASETIARGIPEESASDGTTEGSVPAKRGGSLYIGIVGTCSLMPVWYCVVGRRQGCELDGVEYFTIDGRDIPAGYSEVDVSVDGRSCSMIAGHVAYALSAKVPGGQLDTLSPAPHWFIVEKQKKSAKT